MRIVSSRSAPDWGPAWTAIDLLAGEILDFEQAAGFTCLVGDGKVERTEVPMFIIPVNGKLKIRSVE
ncbi:hypothetical protein FBZ98_11253 [Rhizobium sp. ERR 922]|uniref:hypothetical protein n=1 Tax=unclassified Rhizobium TaxID=2613769 RepID=UPI0011A38BC6|nr:MULTISPECIES: hypothetical protein [unclassified Rhizobium]TWB46405.1 hypothetical protein FBZ98_11253 [Rhizobium sp. ERR 922]TWB88772.1 hypothetical protein FBZ97_11253 [Rhizobium sp. ERR 942]